MLYLIQKSFLLKNRKKILAVTVSSFFTLLIFPLNVYYSPQVGLDPSWQMSIQYAFANNLIFGDQIIFTYGPLGYLTTRYPMGVSKFQIIIFDIYFLILFGYFLFRIFEKNLDWKYLLITSIVLFPINNLFNQDLVFGLSFVVLFLSFRAIQTNSVFDLFNLIILSTIIFFIKANVGLFIILISIASVLLLLIGQTISVKRSIAWLSLQLIAIVFFSYLYNVSIFNYIASSFSVVSGYGEAMAYQLDQTYSYILTAALILSGLFLLAVGISLKYVFRNITACYFIGCVSFFCFIAFKQSFIRADSAHYYTFFYFAPIYFVLLYFFLESRVKFWFAHLVVVSSISTLLVFNRVDIFKINSFITRFQRVSQYFESAIKHDGNPPDYSYLISERLLPDSLLNVIKDKSVDIIPFETSYLLLNKLNYHPRPIIQSYSAYSYFLDSRNEDFYKSIDAPDYIIFSLQTIDGRHPFWDESITKRALLTHYELILPNYKPFNEELYLTFYPEIDAAVKVGNFGSGWDHYKSFGNRERRSINFNEVFYLETNPDIKNAFNNKQIKSGYEHFLKYGIVEGRDPNFVPLLFDEKFYLEKYPDVRSAVNAGTFKTGYNHYLTYGYKEARIPSEFPMVFKKRSKPLSFAEVDHQNFSARFGEDIEVKESAEPIYMYADVKKSFMGKIGSILYKPDILKISITYADGTVSSFRVISEILKTGVLINRKIETNPEAYSFFKLNGYFGKITKSIRFEVEDQSSWVKDIDIEFKTLKLE